MDRVWTQIMWALSQALPRPKPFAPEFCDGGPSHLPETMVVSGEDDGDPARDF